ncbi:MAG: DUF962 domain-containing protein [Planctomycetaceae bacterium]|nr:DUF962 domain-containing protein [Planctomycetaceae bacterium]
MNAPRRNFREFYRYYLTFHRTSMNRLLHTIGGLSAIVCLVAAVVLKDWRPLAAAPLCGYGLAWIGHFAFERNRPTVFQHPLWSFFADWRMIGEVLTGRSHAGRKN